MHFRLQMISAKIKLIVYQTIPRIEHGRRIAGPCIVDIYCFWDYPVQKTIKGLYSFPFFPEQILLM